MLIFEGTKKTISKVQPLMGVACFPDRPLMPKVGPTYVNHLDLAMTFQ